MDQTKRIFKFQNYDLKKKVGTFWAVIFIVNLLMYGLTIYLNSNLHLESHITIGLSNNEALSIMGANTMPIIIFLIIYGIIMHHEDFALALSLGVTRGGFYQSVIINNLLVVSIFAMIQGILQFFDKYLIELLGKQPLLEFGLFNIEKDSILIIILALFMFYLTIASISNLIGVLQYRFGYKFWIGFGLTALIVRIEPANIFMELSARWGNNMVIFLLEIIIIIICYTIGYLFIKKANIKK